MDKHMSQYPPGYPSHVGYSAQPMGIDPHVPAKSASLMMIIVGSVGLLFGSCLGMAFLVSSTDLMTEMQRRGRTLPPGVTIEQVLTAMKSAAFVLVLGGILELALGIIVRRGRLGGVVASLVFTVLVMVSLLAEFIAAMLHRTYSAGALFCSAILLLLAAVQLVLLLQAKRAVGQVENMHAAYQAQYWQYMQQQQAYQQGTAAPQGYGGTPAYGANTYNAPPPGATGAPPAQSGWQWPGQPSIAPPPPPIPLPPPPNDVDHDKQA
jgi:hypothetical protein